MRDVVILGSTGSIGTQALEVISQNPDKFRLVGLSAGENNLNLLIEQVRKFDVPVVGTSGDDVALKEALPKCTVIDANHKKTIRIYRFARPHHVVPPA